MEQPPGQRGAERRQLAPQHRHQMHLPFPARERVAKLLARRQRGRTRRENLHFRKQVRPNLEHATRIAQLVNLVEDHDGLVAIAVEQRRVAHHVLGGRQVAIDAQDARRVEALRQGRLARAPRAAKPRNGRFFPRGFESLKPERSFDHAGVVCFWSDYL